MMSLSFQRYQFNFILQQDLILNTYSGSLLRGVFGQALRKTVCMTKLKQCSTCPLYQTCPYTLIFETPPPAEHQLQRFSQIPNPYIIEPPSYGKKIYRAGDTFCFSLVLIGQAIAHLALIIFVWQTAFKWGIAKEKITGYLDSVFLMNTFEQKVLIYAPETDKSIREHALLPVSSRIETNQVMIQLISPLHIKKEGKVLAHDMSAKDFLIALARRYYLLCELHGEYYTAPDFTQLVQQASGIQCESKLRWCAWQRYSNRQQSLMRFDGVLGELVLTGDLNPFSDLLIAGQYLHVGSKTTFGMGQYGVSN